MTTLNFTNLVKKRLINQNEMNLCGDDLDAVVMVLKESKVLEELRLDGNNLTLADRKFTDALANNRTLKYLFLDHNKIGVDGAKNIANALKVNKTLRELWLHGNKIGDEGAKHLADALKENESLELIDLQGSNVGDEGAKSIADSLCKNQRLRCVNLYENNIGDDGATQLLEALKWNYEIKDLDIINNPVSEHVKAEIKGVLNDPCRKVPNAQVRHLHEVIASKDETIASKNNLIATKDQELNNKDEVVKGKDEEIGSKSTQDEMEAVEASLNDTRDIKAKKEPDVTTDGIYNADTDDDDDEAESPEKKKQKTERRESPLAEKDLEISDLKQMVKFLNNQLMRSKLVEPVALTETGDEQGIVSDKTSATIKQPHVDNAFTKVVKLKKEKVETQARRLMSVKQENASLQNRLVQVKQERDKAYENAEIEKMMREAIVVEKRSLEDESAFAKRVLENLVTQKQNLERDVAFARATAASAWQEKEEALKITECPICHEVGNDFIAFVPCGHGMCDVCILAHAQNICHTCQRKVGQTMRLRR